MSTDNNWSKRAAFKLYDQSHFVMLDSSNNNSFVVVHYGVYKYNLQKDEWYTIIQAADYTGSFEWEYAAAALNNHLLYISDIHGSIITINLTDKCIKTLTNDDEILSISGFSNGIMINNEYHLIGGEDNNKHLKWNAASKHWETVHTFDEFKGGVAFNRLIHVKSKHFMVAFGGCAQLNMPPLKHFDTMYQYQIEQNKWHKLAIKMPKAVYTGKPVLAIRNQFVIFFGCFGYTHGDQSDIFIFSISQQRFMTAKIKCPTTSIYSAIVISDGKIDEKIVFGYIREQWKLSKINNDYFPPTYLLKLIALYFLTEYVHILDERKGVHWKISTLDIV